MFKTKKFFPYIIVFFVVFSATSFVMMSLKKKIEHELSKIHSAQLKKSIGRVEEKTEPKEPLRKFRKLFPEEIKEMQAELVQKIDLYENRVGLIRKKEKELDSFEADLENQKKELISMRGKLSDALSLICNERVALNNDLIVLDEIERKNLIHLADVYKSMEPSRAAKILNKINGETSAKILAGMPSKKSSSILAEINPKAAAKLSEYMKKLEIVNKSTGESLKQRNQKKLAKIYQEMDADKAVAIIEELDDETAVNVLSYMDEKKLARILELVKEEDATELTEKIRKKIKKGV